MKGKRLRENQTVVVTHNGQSAKGVVVNSPAQGKVTVSLPAEKEGEEPQQVIFDKDDLEPMGAVGGKFRGDGGKATSPPREYAAFKRYGGFTCIRVSIGSQFTKYIPMHAEGLAVETMENAKFGRTYKQLEGYGLGTAVFHYLQAGKRFGITEQALTHLLSLQQYITEAETEALVAKLKKEKPSMTSAELRTMITKGLPPEQYERMQKVGHGAMAIVAKNNPESASAKYLAAEKKGPKALEKHLKEDAKKSRQTEVQSEVQSNKETEMKAKTSKKSTKPAKAEKPAKAAKPAKAQKPAKAAKTNGKKPPTRTASAFSDKATIKVIGENPKREGTAAHARFAVLIKHKNVNEALKHGAKFGLNGATLRKYERKGHIKIVG